MGAPTLFRIASVIFVLFAAGHTYGFLRFKPPTPEGLAAQAAMNNVSFPIGGSSYSLGGFYLGFGLSISVYMLFSAFLAWQLAGLSAEYPRAARGIAWGFFASQLPGLVLAFKYFGLPPVIFSALVAALLGIAAFKIGR